MADLLWPGRRTGVIAARSVIMLFLSWCLATTTGHVPRASVRMAKGINTIDGLLQESTALAQLVCCEAFGTGLPAVRLHGQLA